MRRVLFALAGALLLAVAAFFVAVPIVLERTLSAEGVAQRASATFGRPVTVERVGVAFRPALRIRAEGVTIEDVGEGEAVEVELRVLPLLRGRIEAAELHLKRPRLHLHRGTDGSLRFAAFGSGGGPGGPLPPIEARDGEIVLMEDGRPADAPRLEILRFELGALSSDGRTPLRLRVAVAPDSGAAWSLADGRLEAFLVRGDRTRLESGRIEGHGAVVRGLSFDHFEGRIAMESAALEIEELVFSGHGGRGRAAGTVRTARPARFEGEFSLEGMDLSGIVGAWRRKPLDTSLGLLRAEGDVRLNLGGSDRGTGAGRIEVREGRLPARSLFGALLGSLGQLTGQIFSFGAKAGPAPSKLEALTASWLLEDGRLHTRDLDVRTDDYRYSAEGSLGLDKTLAFEGDLQLTSTGIQRLLASAALPLPAATPVIPRLPLRVVGSLDSPTPEASMLALPSAAKGALVGLVKGGAGIVTGTARKGKDALGKVIGR